MNQQILARGNRKLLPIFSIQRNVEYSDNQGQMEVEVSSVSNLVRDDTLKLTSEAFSLASVVDETYEEHLVIAHLTIEGLFSIYLCCPHGHDQRRLK